MTVTSSFKVEQALPPGWVEAALPAVCELNPPKPRADAVPPETPVTFVPMPAVDADAGAITAPQERPFSDVRKGFTSFGDGDVIVAKITPCFENGKAAIARGLRNGMGFGSTEFHVLRSNGAVLPEYVYYFMRQDTFRREGAENMTGSVGQKRVPADFMSNVVIPLPPLAEQKRIVAKVEEVLARVNAARERLAKAPIILKRFRQAVLAAACSGRLTADLRSSEESGIDGYLAAISKRRNTAWTDRSSRRCPDPISVDTPDLPEIPSSWRWVSADSICAQITDGEHIQPKYQPVGKPMLTATHVRDGYVLMEDYGNIADTDFERCLQRCAPTQNDILVVSVGATTGRSAIVGNCPPFAIVRSVLLLRPLIEPEYLLRWCQSPWCFRWMTEASGASAQPHLYINDTKRMPVPIPPPDEQKEILKRVSVLFELVEKIKRRVLAASSRADTIVQATLAKAFRGELVPTEAELAEKEGRGYETAAQLLERLRGQSTDEPPAEAPKRAKRQENGIAATLFDPGPRAGQDRPSKASKKPKPTEDDGEEEISYDEAMAYIREVFAEGGARDREQAIRDVAQAWGYERVGHRVRENIEGCLKAAVRRGILDNVGNVYSLVVRTGADYTRDHLIDMLMASIDGAWTAREDAMRATAAHLGFRKAGSAFKEEMKSAINGAIRRGLLEYDGDMVRKAK